MIVSTNHRESYQEYLNTKRSGEERSRSHRD